MDKQIEEVFKKYAGDMSEMDEAGMDRFHFTEALRNGDLYLKSDIERARIEAKIEVLKSVYKKYSADLGYSMPEFVKDYYEELEQKLRSLKNEQD